MGRSGTSKASEPWPPVISLKLSFPLPPLAAIAGFLFMLVDPRRNQEKGGNTMLGLAVTAAVALSGTLIYFIRARRLGQWPLAPSRAELSS